MTNKKEREKRRLDAIYVLGKKIKEEETSSKQGDGAEMGRGHNP